MDITNQDKLDIESKLDSNVVLAFKKKGDKSKTLCHNAYTSKFIIFVNGKNEVEYDSSPDELAYVVVCYNNIKL